MTNCTLTCNSAYIDPDVGLGLGGGALQSTLHNCTITSNSAWRGGGAWGGTLNNCRLTVNSASSVGGGAWEGTLNNCQLAGNSASEGGGFYSTGGLNNCVVYYNTATNGANYFGDPYGLFFNNCCTTPLPAGPGNIDSEPVFVNANGWSNLRLQSNSPCINAGNSAYVITATDLDGRPRVVVGAVDMGAYEYQGPGVSDFIPWLQQYGLPTDGSADFTDPDGDRANNWQEWQCATVPTNAFSALRLLVPQTVGTDLVVTWQSVTNKTYTLERSTGLATNASFLPLASNLVGQAGSTTFTDTNAAIAAPRFYRVGVQ